MAIIACIRRLLCSVIWQSISQSGKDRLCFMKTPQWSDESGGRSSSLTETRETALAVVLFDTADIFQLLLQVLSGVDLFFFSVYPHFPYFGQDLCKGV